MISPRSAMKTIVVLSALIAMCAGNTIPSVPQDNSHYVEGVSRYIWMPDGEGLPQLVDLQASAGEDVITRNGADNQYWLYTRSNPATPQHIFENKADSIWSSNYVPNKPLRVIVHGWIASGHNEINPMLTDAILEVEDANVIVVDWNALANSSYLRAVLGVHDIGERLGQFLSWLLNSTGESWSNVHLIGFSLGAHIVGYAGRSVNGQIPIITGLDPAGPLFWGSNNSLKISDAQYVEVIHTDGGIMGLMRPMGHADYYPNGGISPQPGCLTSPCSHSRAPRFMAASIRFNQLVGRKCNNLIEARISRCSGEEFAMGNGFLGKHGKGIYGLTTGSEWPF